MHSVPSLPTGLRTVLTTVADAAARPTGFVQRSSKLTGALFAQTLVFGWLHQPHASLDQLSQMAALLGVNVRAQAMAGRFSPASAALLEQILAAGVAQTQPGPAVPVPLLARFRAVVLQDSTTLTLPDALARVWRGNGGTTSRNTSAAVKLQLRFDLTHGTLVGPLLQDGRASDQTAPIPAVPVAAGALQISDLGYFSLARLAAQDCQGVFWLTRLLHQTAVYDAQGKRLNLLRQLRAAGPSLDQPIRLGVTQRIQCRLLAIRVPQEVADQRRRRLREEARSKGQTVSDERLALASWTILVTNVPADQLSLAEALVLARARWQIELLVKLWKQHGGLAAWRTADPWRILTEVYAKLLALLVQHWLLIQGFWTRPNRSLVKGAQVVRSLAPILALAYAGWLPGLSLAAVLAAVSQVLTAGCLMNRRKAQPNTYQLLLDPSLNCYEAA
jgi:hypothetical protein